MFLAGAQTFRLDGKIARNIAHAGEFAETGKLLRLEKSKLIAGDR
jgi:hypothetical protein